MEPVVVIAGPTASGKTSLSVELAKRINGSIVSADSMQIYKYMDIGTAKPTEQEMSGIRHYMMDEVEPMKTTVSPDTKKEPSNAYQQYKGWQAPNSHRRNRFILKFPYL